MKYPVRPGNTKGLAGYPHKSFALIHLFAKNTAAVYRVFQ